VFPAAAYHEAKAARRAVPNGGVNTQHLEELRLLVRLVTGSSKCWGDAEADSPRVFAMALTALLRV